MCCSITLIIYTILEIAALILFVVGTPLDQFRAKSSNEIGNTDCLTLWGCKSKCYSTTYDYRIKENFDGCPDRYQRFQAGQAFSIITIALAFLCFIFAIGMNTCCSYCRCCLRILLSVLNLLAIAGGAVVWGCMVAAYYKKHNACPSLQDYYACAKYSSIEGNKTNDGSKYGAGFGLFVVAWALQTINMIVIMLPC